MAYWNVIEESTGNVYQVYIPNGTILYCCPENEELTLKLKLGGEVLASVPEKYRGRVVGWRHPRRHDEYVSNYGDEGTFVSGRDEDRANYRIILSPEPVPASKSDHELLRDLVQTYEAYLDSTCPEDVAHDAALDAAKERVNG